MTKYGAHFVEDIIFQSNPLNKIKQILARCEESF